MILAFSARQQAKDFVLIGNMALQEMHRLDEATGAPLDFRREEEKNAPSFLSRLASFLFTSKPFEKAPEAKPVDEQKAIARLRPQQAFELGLQRVKEYQYQGTFPMLILGVATNLALFGYYSQHGHLNLVDGATAPAIVAFNLLAGVAGSMLVQRCKTIKLVRAGYKHLGEAGLTRELSRIKSKLDEHDSYRLTHRIGASIRKRLEKISDKNTPK